jgi:alkylation response protein AidB-like acyl-CoA dehydrogenase
VDTMLAQPETETPIENDPESVVNLDYAVSDARASFPTAGSLLDLSPAHAEYARRLAAIVEREAPLERGLEWDRAKMPPLPVLRAMVDEGIFVSGVPIPDLSHARPFADELVRSGVIDTNLLARLEHPSASKRQAQEAFLQQLGGEGHARAMGIAAQATARLGGVGIGTFMGVSTGLSAQTIYRVGTLAQQAFWLNALHRGTLTYGFALTEKNAGSDPRSMTTTFVRETGEGGQTVYRLSGDKKFIGNAARVVDAAGNVVHRGADFLLVFAVDDPAKPPKDRVFHCFLVPRGRIGEENIRHTGGEWNKTGLREVNNGNFDLRDVVVPECCVLGTPGENMYPKLLGTLDVTRFLVGAMGVGTAEAALDIARQYSQQRNQNGIPIARYPMIAHPLRELEARVLVGRLLIQEAATLVDQADRDRQELSDKLTELVAEVAEIEGALANLFTSHSARDTQQACDEAIAKCKTALDERGQRLKLSERKAMLQDAVQSLHAQTRKLRDHAPTDLVPLAKSVFRRSQKVLDAMDDAQEPTRFGTETAMAKLYGSELAQQAIYQARQTLGGNGYLENPEEGLGLGKRSRDAEVLTIYEGQSNIQRGIIAQGILMQHLKKVRMPLLAPGAIWQKLNFLLLNSRLTKETHYKILMSTSRTPVERTNAAFKYAVVDVMGRYSQSLQAVKERWRREGVPAEYRDWDEGSLERQQNFLAANPIQARLALLADLAVYRKLIHLASRELERSRQSMTPATEQEQQREFLEEFLVFGVERVLELVSRLSGDYLAMIERKLQLE